MKSLAVTSQTDFRSITNKWSRGKLMKKRGRDHQGVISTYRNREMNMIQDWFWNGEWKERIYTNKIQNSSQRPIDCIHWILCALNTYITCRNLHHRHLNWALSLELIPDLRVLIQDQWWLVMDVYFTRIWNWVKAKACTHTKPEMFLSFSTHNNDIIFFPSNNLSPLKTLIKVLSHITSRFLFCCNCASSGKLLLEYYCWWNS